MEFLVENRTALQSRARCLKIFNSKHSIHFKFRENCDAYLHFPFQNLVSITDPLREFHRNNRCKPLLNSNNIFTVNGRSEVLTTSLYL